MPLSQPSATTFETLLLERYIRCKEEDFPGGPAVKNPPANTGHRGSIPGPGRFHMPQGN